MFCWDNKVIGVIILLYFFHYWGIIRKIMRIQKNYNFPHNTSIWHLCCANISFMIKYYDIMTSNYLPFCSCSWSFDFIPMWVGQQSWRSPQTSGNKSWSVFKPVMSIPSPFANDDFGLVSHILYRKAEREVSWWLLENSLLTKGKENAQGEYVVWICIRHNHEGHPRDLNEAIQNFHIAHLPNLTSPLLLIVKIVML